MPAEEARTVELIRRTEERSDSLLQRIQRKLAELQASASEEAGLEDEFEPEDWAPGPEGDD